MYNDCMKKNNIKEKEEYSITKEAVDFFYSNEARGIRLQFDYEKAETKIREAGIEYTIVVFGSARIKPSEDVLSEIKPLKMHLKKMH